MFTVLIFVSALAAVLYLVSSLLQIVRGRAQAGFWGTFFLFLVVLCALMAVYGSAPALSLVRSIALVIAIAMIVVDAIFLLLELRLTPRALKTSRAILGLTGGVLIALGVIAFPYRTVALQALGQRVATNAGFNAAGTGSIENASFSPGQGIAAPGAASTGEAVAPPSAEGTQEAVANKPTEASQALEAETGLAVDELTKRVSGGETMASLVQAHGGDLDKVKTALSNTLKQMVQDAITAGTMQQAQADRMLSSVDESVSSAVEGQLPAQFFDRLILPAITGQPISGGFGPGGQGGGQAAPNGTEIAQPQPDGTAEAFPPPDASGSSGGFPAQANVAPTATPTPFPASTALPARPTEPSPTPTNTPYVIATLIPAGTVTPGAPNTSAQTGDTAGASASTSQQCVGYTNHNVNLRSGPGTDTDVLMTVTPSSQLQIDGRSEDSTWLAVTFQEKSGWMDARYIDLVGKCSAIPVKSS